MKTAEREIEESSTHRSPWLFVASMVLAGVLLVLALRGVRWQETGTTIRHCRLDLLLVAALALTLSYFARGVRWQLLIGAATSISLPVAFWTTMSSYLANNILPGRPGDVIRPVLTSRIVKTSVSYALTAVFIERIGDILALVAMSVGVSFSREATPIWLRGMTHAFAIGGVLGAIGLVLIAPMDRFLGSVVARLPLPAPLCAKVGGLADQIVLGVLAVRRPGKILSFAGLTALIWLLDVVTGKAIAWATHVSISWIQMTLLLVALSLASALPSTPGNIGVFPFVAISVLVPFGLTRGYALAYILVFQAVTYLVESGWGGVGLWCLTATRDGMAATSVGSQKLGAMVRAVRVRVSSERVSLTAVASLVCAVLGWLAVPVAGSIASIILGHCAQRVIGRSHGVLRGNGIATTGLILSYTQLLVLVMLIGMTRLPPQIG